MKKFLLVLLFMVLFIPITLTVSATESDSEEIYTTEFDGMPIYVKITEGYVYISADNATWKRIDHDYAVIDEVRYLVWITEDERLYFKFCEGNVLEYREDLDNYIPLEENELSYWFDQKVMPFIVTALGGLTGTGILTALLAFFVNKLKKRSNEAIDKATTALNLSAKEATDLKNQVAKQLDEYSKKIEELINTKIEEAIKNLNIASEDVIASRDRQLKVSESILEGIKKLEGGLDENKD